MATHVKRLEHISQSPDHVTEKTAEEFITLMKNHYPNGKWKKWSSVEKSVQNFESHLENSINAPWAKKKLKMFQDFKNARVALAWTIVSASHANTPAPQIQTPHSSSRFETVTLPKYKKAILTFQGRLVKGGYLEGTNEQWISNIDGIAGDLTYQSTLAYISKDPKGFQSDLNLIFPHDQIVVDGDVREKTLKKLRDNTGISIQENMLLASAINVAVKEIITKSESLKAKQTSELVSDLKKLKDTPKNYETRNMILSTLAKKFQEENIIVYMNATSNRWELKNNAGKANTPYTLEQSDLVVIALTGTISPIKQEEWELTETSIPAIFDSVVEEFTLKNETENRPWVHNDMISDAAGYAGNKKENREAFVKQLLIEIKALEKTNTDPKIQDFVKEQNHIKIQKLEILKAEMTNNNGIDPKAKESALAISGSSIIRQTYFDNNGNPSGDIIADIANGDILKKVTGSGLLPAAIVFGLASIFFNVPKWLKYPSYGILLATVLGWPFRKIAKTYGLDKEAEKLLRGGLGHSPAQASPNEDQAPGKIEEFFARVPWVDRQFTHWYALILNEHDKHDNWEGKNTFPEKDLETIFSLSARYPSFTSMKVSELKANKTDLDKIFWSDVKAAAIDAWVSEKEMRLYIDFLLSAQQSGDITVADILSDGRYDETQREIKSYVEWEDTFNKAIRDQVEKLSVSPQSSEKWTRERVEAAIDVSLPNILYYQSTDKAELDGVITNLEKIQADSKISANDKKIIWEIIKEYSTIRDNLGNAEEVQAWQKNADKITDPIIGKNSLTALYNGVSDGLAWISGLPVSILGKIEWVTADQIDKAIKEWEALKTKHRSNATLVEKISVELSQLQEKKVFLLQNHANTFPKGSSERAANNAAAIAALSASINANPKEFKKRVDALALDIDILKNPQAHGEGYFEILRQNGSSILALQNIMLASTNNPDIHKKATDIYNKVINTYSNNFEWYVKRKQAELEGIKTAISWTLTPNELELQAKKYDALRSELIREGYMVQARKLAYQYGFTINGQDTDSIDLITLTTKSLVAIGAPITPLAAGNMKSQLDDLNTLFTQKWIESVWGLDISSIALTGFESGSIQATIADVQIFKTAIETAQTSINTLAGNSPEEKFVIKQQQKALDQRVSDYITKLSEQALWTPNLDDLDEVALFYGLLDDLSRKKDTFKEAISKKRNTLAKKELQEELSKVTIASHMDKLSSIWSFIWKYSKEPKVAEVLSFQLGATKLSNGNVEIDDSKSVKALIEAMVMLSNLSHLSQTQKVPDGFKREAEDAIAKTMVLIQGNKIITLSEGLKKMISNTSDTLRLLTI